MQNITRNRKKLLFMLILILLFLIGIVVYFLVYRPGVYGDNQSLSEDNEISQSVSNRVVDQYSAKLPSLESRVSENPDVPEFRREYAVALYATGDTVAAREQYEEEVKLNRDDSVLYNNLGNVYRDLGDFEKAVESYQRSIELDSGQFNAYNNLANLLIFTLDDLDRGIETYTKAMEHNEDRKSSLMLLMASAYEQKGYKENAVKKYSEVLALNEQDAAAVAGLARLSQ